MTLDVRLVDDPLLTDWRDWITAAVKRFGATGYAKLSTSLTWDTVAAITHSPDLLFSSAIITPDGSRGIVLVVRATWETEVLSRTVAKVAWLAADDYEIAHALATAALENGRIGDVVLLSASPGHSPAFIHVALTEAGFHVGSQTHTVWSDIERNAEAVKEIPLRGTFRDATPADADAIGELARAGFSDQRFARDPFFPREWGEQLYAAWARNLVLGAADSVVVAESWGKVVGFASMTLDERRRALVPPLLAVDHRHEGLGKGPMLVRIMFEWYQARGVRYLIGGTEKSSAAINTLYLRLGGSIVDSNIIYHATPALGRAVRQGR